MIFAIAPTPPTLPPPPFPAAATPVPALPVELPLLQRCRDFARAIRSVFAQIGLSHDEAAIRCRMSPSHLTRMLDEHGANLVRLANLGTPFWQRFLVPLTVLVNLTREDVLKAFGADAATEEARQKKDREQDERIARLEQLVKQYLPTPPPPEKESQ